MMLITLYCGGIACNTHRGSEKTVTPTENTLPLCRTSRVAQPLKHLHKQAKNAWQPTWCKQRIQQSWCGQRADNSAHKVQICLHAVTHWYSMLYKQKCRVQTKSRKAVWDIIPNIFARIYYTTHGCFLTPPPPLTWPHLFGKRLHTIMPQVKRTRHLSHNNI